VVPEYPPIRHLYTLALAAKMAEVSRRFGLVILHVHYALPHTAAALLARSILGNPSRPRLVTTLHGTDVTLLGLTNAYRTLANGGRHSPVATALGKSPAPVRLLDAAAAFLVADILADDNARVRTFGWASPLATRGFAAVKTGTSKDMRDNWCLGFTDRYTIGVWVGNASGEAMHDVSGTSGAAPVWQAIAAYLHAGSPSKAPPLATGVAVRRVAFDGRREPERDELFLVGSERTRVRASEEVVRGARYGIAIPRDGRGPFVVAGQRPQLFVHHLMFTNAR